MGDLGTFVPKTLVCMRSLDIQDCYRIWTLLGLGKNWKHDLFFAIEKKKEARSKNQETRSKNQETRDLSADRQARAEKPIWRQAGKR
jgi:hypothetical protein